jgi:ribose transport system ATP-binding protein
MQRLKVVAPSAGINIESLSGGNQQKVVLGKWLMSKSLQVLLLDHPTRGLDPGAREDLYAAIRDAAASGLSIVMVGDTVEEILAISQTVIVMKDGLITARYDLTSSTPVSERDIVAAML